MLRVGMLTSGGDCQALNAAMRGVVKYLYNNVDDSIEIYGFVDGYKGLIENNYRLLGCEDFDGILNKGGTILGTSRQPFKQMGQPDEKGREKVPSMVNSYHEDKLDCLVVLGGNGTHKTANLLYENGLNVITLPKTIDNDLACIDMTFGFQSAIDIASDYIEKLRTTACSHSRIFVVEIMGHKTGWLTLHSGIASDSDIVLIPEIPYDIDKISECIEKKIRNGKEYIIIAAAEGIISKEEAAMEKKALKKKRKEEGNLSAARRVAGALESKTNKEIRTAVIGHIQRGGTPCAYDRVLATRLGVKAGELIKKKTYGYMVSMAGTHTAVVPLGDVAGKTKFVEPDDELVIQAKKMGICFGD